MMYSIKNKLRTFTIRAAGVLAGIIAVYAAVQMLGFMLKAFISQRPVASGLTAVGTNVLAQSYPDFVLSGAKNFATGYVRHAYRTGSPLGEEAAKQIIDRNLVGRGLTFAFDSACEAADYTAKNMAIGAAAAARYAFDGASYYAHSAARRSRHMFAY